MNMIRRECAARGLPPLLAVDLIGSGAAPPRWRWRESAPPGNAQGTSWRLVFGPEGPERPDGQDGPQPAGT